MRGRNTRKCIFDMTNPFHELFSQFPDFRALLTFVFVIRNYRWSIANIVCSKLIAQFEKRILFVPASVSMVWCIFSNSLKEKEA